MIFLMSITLNKVIKDTLIALKREPDRQLEIVRDGRLTTVVRECFDLLGIAYQVVEQPSEPEPEENGKKRYGLHLKLIEMNDHWIDYNQLEKFWRYEPAPKQL